MSLHDHNYPDVPGHKGTDTAIAAADAMEPHCARLQRMALKAIREAGADGLTAEELADTVGVERVVIQPRTSELRLKRMIADSGQRRRNRSGKKAIVWVAAPREVEAANG